MTEADPIAGFYDRHPYPPPVSDLTAAAADWEDGTRRRIEHHRHWPSLPFRDDHSILVAGCGTSQAARYAIRYPRASVVGIDVSPTSITRTRTLSEQHGLTNLEVRELSIEQVADLDETFDQIVCTGVIHHLADPGSGLQALRNVLAAGGALQLMVYAKYGRAGVEMMQAYGRLLGIDPTTAEIDDLVASLRELPLHHPLSHLLRDTPDFADDDALADALLNPRERSYSVSELFDLLDEGGLNFARWLRQAPYLASCGSLSTVPHGASIAALDEVDGYSAVELFRGTMTRHTAIARRDDDTAAAALTFDAGISGSYVPIRDASAISVTERLPPGASAALLNRAHSHPDLVLFANESEHASWDAIDGTRTIGDIGGDPEFFARLWEHDLIVIDSSQLLS